MLADITRHPNLIICHPLLSQFPFLVDHPYGQKNENQAGKQDCDQKKEDLFAVTPAFH
jgi:hypothetical protein